MSLETEGCHIFVYYVTMSIGASYKIFLIFISSTNVETAELKAVLSHPVKREAFNNMGNHYSYYGIK